MRTFPYTFSTFTEKSWALRVEVVGQSKKKLHLKKRMKAIWPSIPIDKKNCPPSGRCWDLEGAKKPLGMIYKSVKVHRAQTSWGRQRVFCRCIFSCWGCAYTRQGEGWLLVLFQLIFNRILASCLGPQSLFFILAIFYQIFCPLCFPSKLFHFSFGSKDIAVSRSFFLH